MRQECREGGTVGGGCGRRRREVGADLPPCTMPLPLPGNFFLNKNMEVKIGDLGLAAKVGPGGRCHG